MKMSNKDREDRGESNFDLSPDLGVIDDLFVYFEENGHFFILLLQTVTIDPGSSHKCSNIFSETKLGKDLFCKEVHVLTNHENKLMHEKAGIGAIQRVLQRPLQSSCLGCLEHSE